jgi:glyoxylase-like metal-dependent hydrolase (beta-lactamase superfamily II)
MVWDTGPPRDWEERWGSAGLNELLPYDDVAEEQYFDSRLAQLGLQPSDIDTVVLSHLHLDHAANARLFEGAGARFVTHEKEVEVGFSFDDPFLGGYCKADYEGLEFETVSGDTQLYPGISVIEVPGHSVGTMALRVDLPDSGTMIFTSDAADSRENYGPPPVGNIVNWCNATFAESVEKLRALEQETGGTLVFSHDYEQLHSLKLAPDAHYT